MDTELLRTTDLARTPIASRPEEPPPPASASYEERADWSERYVGWFIAQTPLRDEPLPPDVEPTHRYEVEFNYCMLDPRRYERETEAELSRRLLH